MDANSLLTHFRDLAIRNPRDARREVLQLINEQPAVARSFLELLDTPKDGRLRHLVANVARELSQRDSIVPFLVQWRSKETDEFTRRAILLALTEVSEPSNTLPAGGNSNPYPDQIAETYQFVATRLKHKLSNGLMRANMHLMRLRTALLPLDQEASTSPAMADLKAEFTRMARALEAIDLDQPHFDLRPIALLDWLKAMNGRYASQFNSIDLRPEGDLDPPAVVLASDYLLETVFWNTWQNAHLAAGSSCVIWLKVTLSAGYVSLVVVDNGPGFPEAIRDVAFRERFSTNGANRGRGLLEIDDAVRRLQGTVRIEKVGAVEMRLRFDFPRCL
jgi:signal transduction histidine kinase